MYRKRQKSIVCLLLVVVMGMGVFGCAQLPVSHTTQGEQARIESIVESAAEATARADLLSGVPTLTKKISLVFLGAADEATMLSLLHLLDQYGVKATFFQPGISVAETPAIARAIAKGGHMLGNYALDGEKAMHTLPKEDVARSLYRTQRILQDAALTTPALFTCDGTEYTDALLAIAKGCGLEHAIKPTNYLNYSSFASEEQAVTYASYTNWGSVVAVKIGRPLDETEIDRLRDEEVLDPAVDPEPTIEKPAPLLPGEENERLLIVMDWLLRAYADQKFGFVSPLALQSLKDTALANQLETRPAAAPVEVISHAATTQKAVALTFEQIGTKEAALGLLDTLDALDAKAAFFVTGQEAIEHSELIRTIVKRGHSIQSGGFFNRSLNRLGYDAIYSELLKSKAAIQKVTGTAPGMYRPAFGKINEDVAKACAALDIIPILYNKNPLAREGKTVEELLTYFSRGFHRGDIIALRMDNYDELDALVEGIADIVYDIGYAFAPLETLYSGQYEKKPLTQIEGWDAIKVNPDYNPRASIRRRQLSRISVNKKVAFITFDDWGDDKAITRILDTLDAYGAKATFFLVGSGVEMNPNLARAIAEAGHDIGNHTYAHGVMTEMSPEALQEDIVKCHQVLTVAIGRAPELYFRPPTLDYNVTNVNAVFAAGFEYSLLSNVSTQDYERPVAEVLRFAVPRARRGDMIILHLDGKSSGVDALPQLIKKLKAKGFEFAKLSDYLKSP